MADSKISALTAVLGADASSSDVLPIVSSSTTKKVTLAELSEAVNLQAFNIQKNFELRQAMRSISGGQSNCFTRTQGLANTTGATGTKYTTTTQVVKWRYDHTALVDCSNLRFVFANFGLKPYTGSAQGESSVGNAIEVNAFITGHGGSFNSKNVQVTFNGLDWVRIEDMAINSTEYPLLAISDYIPVSLEAGEMFYGLYRVRVDTVGHFIPTSLVQATSTLVEGIATGDYTAAANSGGGSPGYHPVMILATPKKGNIFSFSVTGDSISQGSGDTAVGGVADYGWIPRALGAYPYVRVLGGGSKLQFFDTADTRRVTSAIIGSQRVAINCQGANDIASGFSVATMKGYLKQWVREALDGGAQRIVVCTMLPYNLAKVNFTTRNGQVPGAGGAPLSISNVANGTPARVTSSGHGLTDGQETYVSDCGNIGPGFYFVDQIDSNTFDLYTDSGLTTGATATGTFSSTHSQCTTANGATREHVRRDYNTWLLNGTFASEVASEIDDIVKVDIWDMASSVEQNYAGASATNGGYWTPSYTTDGLHPIAAGYVAMGTLGQSYADAMQAKEI